MATATFEGLVIDGERVPAAEGATFDSLNPATGTRSPSITRPSNVAVAISPPSHVVAGARA